MSTESDCQKAFAKCKVVLLDVAGTTTSLTFVRETLFKYVAENVEAFLKENWDDKDTKIALKVLNEDKDVADIDCAVKLVKDAIEKQPDNAGLKNLNGYIYKKGFEDGTLKAHVYSDVPVAFNVWSKNRKIAIYSTGSVESQKLLFKHSVEGDLSSNVTQYFDQSVGLKTESESYLKIVKELNVAANEVLWISDIKEEIAAATKAGLLTILIDREPEEEPSAVLKITSFAELITDNSNNKRRTEIENVCEDEPPSKVSKRAVSEDNNEQNKYLAETIKASTSSITVPQIIIQITDDINPNELENLKVKDKTESIHEEKMVVVSTSTEVKESKMETDEQILIGVATPDTIDEPVIESVTELMETDQPKDLEMKTDSKMVRNNSNVELMTEMELIQNINEKSESKKVAEIETVEIEDDTVKEISKIPDDCVLEAAVTQVNGTFEVQLANGLSTTKDHVIDIELITSTDAPSFSVIHEALPVTNLEKEGITNGSEPVQGTEANVSNKNDDIVVDATSSDETNESALVQSSSKESDAEVTESNSITNKTETSDNGEVTSTVESKLNDAEINGKTNGTTDCEINLTKVDNDVEPDSQDEVIIKKIDTATESAAVSIEA